MKKFLLLLTVCFAFMFVAQAQLSEGQPRSTTIKTGNRPQQGDWGFYIGPSFSEVVDMINWAKSVKKDKGIAIIRGIPLLNIKYYCKDNIELRAGLQFYDVVNKDKGTYMLNDKNFAYNNKTSNAFFRITPGFAYHFTSKNIVDVYLGAQLPLGLDIDKNINENGDLKNNATRTSLVLGLGVFAGLQVFVADLPLSIGLECGLSGLLKTGQKVKNEVTDAAGQTQVYYTTLEEYNNGTSTMQFTKLNSSKYELGNDFRLTFTYYFNNKK